MSQKVYFDESGFTGTNLLNQDQTVFTYAAVGLDNQNANELINIIRTNYPTQAQELKFKNYSKSSKCEDFCLFVINLLKDCAGVIVFDKKFALCAKFFEYMFEPVIAKFNSYFYAANFHLFITYRIYNLLGNLQQTPLLVNFENVMTQDNKYLEFQNFVSDISPKLSIQRKSKRTFEENVYTFISLNRRLIEQELKDLSGNTPTDKYTLDLTTTAFLNLCGFMSEKFGEVEPVYDDSKMMDAHKKIFDGFVGRKIEFETPVFNRKFKVFISKELVAANSKLEPAIQLADLLAGITSYAYSRQNDKITDALVENNFVASAVIPRTTEMQIVNLYPKDYEKILDILVKRSIANKPLFYEEIYRLLWVLSKSCNEILKLHNERINKLSMSQTS